MEITTGCPSNCKYIHGNKCIATECKREVSTTYIVHKCNEEYYFYPEITKGNEVYDECRKREQK